MTDHQYQQIQKAREAVLAPWKSGLSDQAKLVALVAAFRDLCDALLSEPALPAATADGWYAFADGSLVKPSANYENLWVAVLPGGALLRNATTNRIEFFPSPTAAARAFAGTGHGPDRKE